ncbi:MAG: colanic acid/amylovoran biosynthesis glycosyltransferase [Solirubrobacteraceae bacterium]|jgi:glycosyltransferase involved in cell wall biosynthesis|nr:colanic acid/amylovoran biosynthesis glycosyltransferase [Solirubrobacteraceae bacterium]
MATTTAGHVLGSYLPRTETFVYTLLRHQRRFRPLVLAGQRHPTGDEYPFEDVVELTPPGAPAPRRALRRLHAYASGYRDAYDHRIEVEARRSGCALLHAHIGYRGWHALTASRRLGVPLVTSFYGDFDLSLPGREPAWAPRYRELFAGGHTFVVEGPASGAYLARLGCPREKIRIHRIGIDLDGFPFSPPVREPGAPLILFHTGRFVATKGIDTSIRAFAAARERLGDSELWLVGDGELRGEYEALARELGVGGAVRFLGSVPHAEYRRLMESAHIGLVPSRTTAQGQTEGGAPTVLLEMQARGIPVAATRHADIPFVSASQDTLVAEEDHAGLADAIVRLARCGEDEWQQRARRGREFVEREHEAGRLGRALESLYEDVLATA